MASWTLDPVGSAILRGCFALLFAVAATHKLRALDGFATTFAAYRILPSGLERPLSPVPPLLEIAVAAGLLIPATYRVASLAGALLLAVYAAAMGLNVLRGRSEIDCGCLGPGRRSAISGGLVARGLALALLLAALAPLRVSGRSIGWLDVFTVAGGVGAIALLYAAVNGLIESARRLDV